MPSHLPAGMQQLLERQDVGRKQHRYGDSKQTMPWTTNDLHKCMADIIGWASRRNSTHVAEALHSWQANTHAPRSRVASEKVYSKSEAREVVHAELQTHSCVHIILLHYIQQTDTDAVYAETSFTIQLSN